MKFTFEDDAPVQSVDSHYDSLFAGYISLDEVLKHPRQIEEVRAAMETIDSFLKQLEDADLLEYY